MPFNLQLAPRTNDLGQQNRGFAGYATDHAGKQSPVDHMHCTFCGFDYLTYRRTCAARRCYECQNGMKPVAWLSDIPDIEPPAHTAISLSPEEIEAIIDKTAAGKVPKLTALYSVSGDVANMTSEQRSEIAELGSAERWGGPEKPGPDPIEIFAEKIVSNHEIDKAERASRQARLALDDGDEGWTPEVRDDAAKGMRDRYLTTRGIGAVNWDDTSDDAKDLWRRLADYAVEIYRMHNGRKTLRSDI